MTEDEKQFLSEKINSKYYPTYNRGSKLWSAAHHWVRGLSAIFSATATFVLKSKWVESLNLPFQNDIAAGASALATLVTAIAAAAGFNRKWQANRISRGRIEQLQLDLSNPDVDLNMVREELKDIIAKHDEKIVGTFRK